MKFLILSLFLMTFTKWAGAYCCSCAPNGIGGISIATGLNEEVALECRLGKLHEKISENIYLFDESSDPRAMKVLKKMRENKDLPEAIRNSIGKPKHIIKEKELCLGIRSKFVQASRKKDVVYSSCEEIIQKAKSR